MSTLKDRLYSESPYDLASENDDKFRDHIDNALEADFVIEVRGGVVIGVHGLTDEESYSIIDWDDIEAGGLESSDDEE